MARVSSVRIYRYRIMKLTILNTFILLLLDSSAEAKSLPLIFKKTETASRTVSSNSWQEKNGETQQIINNNKITVSFTGDLIIHDDLYKKVMSDPEHDFSKLWEKTIPLFKKADFSYLNLEGPTALGIDNKLKNKGDVGFTYDLETYSGTNFLFNYHPTLLDSLKKTGVDIVSFANNHTFDRGALGIDLTLQEAQKRNLQIFGARPSNHKNEPLFTVSQIKNLKVAWIACSEFLNGFKDKFSQVLLCYEQKKEILELIQKIKKDKLADVIILTPHWGVEYAQEPRNNQRQWAYNLLDEGASVIIGSHPHVLQPAEKYVTKDQRETFIAYSLGNFVAFQRDIERKTSALVYLEFTKNESGLTEITNYWYEPTTRSRHDIFPAKHLPAVVEHVKKFLGPASE